MRRKITYDNQQYRAMLGRLISAYGRRGAEGDSTDLTEIAELGGLVTEALGVAVAGQRAAGASWSYIGEALGISKQAASARFGDRMSA